MLALLDINSIIGIHFMIHFMIHLITLVVTNYNCICNNNYDKTLRSYKFSAKTISLLR